MRIGIADCLPSGFIKYMHCLAAMETGFVHSESILLGYILLTEIFSLFEVHGLIRFTGLLMTRIAGMMSVIVTQLEPCVKSRIVPKVLLSTAVNTSEL